MHQLLRILYVDQLTPVQRIFRVENFDTWQTRQAVGDLLTGVGGYALYEKQIALRETEKQYEAAAQAYRSLVAVASGSGENILTKYIQVSTATPDTERSEFVKSLRDLFASSGYS